jgi:NAD+ diphosphatase
MSNLTELFGTGNNAYFSNGPITRLSFLRTDHKLLDAASTHSSTKYLTFDNLSPLSKGGEFVILGYEDVQNLIGRPYEKNEKTLSNEFDPSMSPPTLVFLGLDLDQDQNAVQLKKYSGTAYFALDVSDKEAFKKTQRDLGYAYKDNRIDLTLSQPSSAILSHSRSLLDWNKRNLFCSSCGGKTMSTHAGAKVICPPSTGRNCPTRIGLHNQAFPRTDPTAIIAPISYDSKRVLLGRNRRWPDNYFSALSGFVEPGESIEQAVRREAYEEAGVKIDRVQIHSTQPWPYPSTLLIGAMGQCFEGCEDVTYPETELEEARWFTLPEIARALDEGANAMWEPPIKGYVGPRVPPPQLMAHQVLKGVLKLFHR